MSSGGHVSLVDYEGVRLTSQNCGHHWRVVHPPGECYWRAVVVTPDFPTRARWQSYQQIHLERIGGMDEGMKILRIQCL
jgi:hypothetical protein